MLLEDPTETQLYIRTYIHKFIHVRSIVIPYQNATRATIQLGKLRFPPSWHATRLCQRLERNIAGRRPLPCKLPHRLTMMPYVCFHKLEVLLAGVLKTRALLFGFYMRAPDSWKLPYCLGTRLGACEELLHLHLVIFLRARLWTVFQ